MQVFDLSHSIHSQTPVYPGTPPVSIQITATHESAGYAEKRLSFSSHTSTHMDAPFHMMPQAKTLDQLHVNKFFGKGFCINCTKVRNRRIGLDDIKAYEEQIKDKDYILINTGWQHYWGTDSYFKEFPTLLEEATAWLLQFPWKGIGVDTISVDPIDAEVYHIHHLILGANRLIVENLTNLDVINGSNFEFYSFPLKIQEADGAPVRAIAIVP